METHNAICRKFALTFLFLSAFVLPTAVAEEARVIREVIISGEGIKNPDQLLRILPFKEGEIFSVDSIAKGVSILQKTGLFESVLWQTEQLPDNGVRVVLALVPVKFIRRIKFKKSVWLFENEIRRAIRVREGDAFNVELIKQDEKRLATYLENQGYFESKVEAQAQPDVKTGDVILTFVIKKGFAYNLLDVRAPGVKVYTPFWMRSVIRRRMLLRYRKDSLNKGVEDILDSYHRNGYFEARIRVKKIEQDPVLRTVIVYLDVHEGPRARVHFKGDRHTTERTLKKKMTLIDEASIEEYDVQESARRMEEFYRSKGYRNVKITYDIEEEQKSGEPLQIITFHIKPGPKVVVKQIVFKGKKEFSGRKLKKQVITGRNQKFWKSPVLVDSVLNDDIAAINAFYRTWGFQEVKVATPELEFSESGRRVKVLVYIDEGTQTTVREVTFEGMEFFTPEQALAKLKLVPGVPFDSTLLAQDKRNVLLLYADRGFPYAQVAQKVESLSTTGEKSVAIRYSVIEDTRVRVGEMLLRGNYHTKSRVLTREVELQPGDAFSYDDLLKSRRNLRTLGFLNSVRLDTLGLEERLDVVNLLLLAQERSSRTFDFGLGYDSEFDLLASLGVQDLNLFGWGKAGKFTISGGGKLNKAELTFSDPRFLGYRVRADLTGTGLEEKTPAFDLTQAALRYALTKKYSQKMKLSVGMRTEYNVLSHVADQSEVDRLNIHKNSVIAIGPQFTYDARNDFIEPSKGLLIIPKLEYGKQLDATSDWLRFYVQGSAYYSPVPKVVLALSASFGHIEPFGSKSLIPFQEAFFVGGNRTVRGFSEDGLGPRSSTGHPLGGLDMIVTNFEIRFPIVSVIHGVVFVDSGQLVTGPANFRSSDQLFTAGTGLRIATPVGPIRIDWGYKLQPNRFEKRDYWHFSFGYPF